MRGKAAGERCGNERRSTYQRLKLDAEARCDRCARFGAFDLGDLRLCEDCYGVRGSCCPEFGADDLWRRDEEPPA